VTFGARVVDFAQKPLGVVWLRDYHAGCTRERGCSIRGFEAGVTAARSGSDALAWNCLEWSANWQKIKKTIWRS